MLLFKAYWTIICHKVNRKAIWIKMGMKMAKLNIIVPIAAKRRNQINGGLKSK